MPSLNQIFVVVPYREGKESGIFTAIFPDKCPLCGPEDNPCRLGLHHLRFRVYGPSYPLCVAICHEHGKIFTMYPPGWTPYGRKPIIHVAEDDSPVDAGIGIDRFVGTTFDAALDAATGKLWPQNANSGPAVPLRSTQSRQLRRTSILFGLDQQDKDSFFTELIGLLDVPGQILADSSQQFKIAKNIEARGRAISDILNRLPSSAFLFQRLAAAGNAVGLWPPLFYWDANRQILLPPLFRPFDRRGIP